MTTVAEIANKVYAGLSGRRIDMLSAGRGDNILRCPFCELPLGVLEEIRTKFGNIIEGGRCGCGAVYVYDGSGHNVGDAYVDGLTLVCNGDLDRAWSLTPERTMMSRSSSMTKGGTASAQRPLAGTARGGLPFC